MKRAVSLPGLSMAYPSIPLNKKHRVVRDVAQKFAQKHLQNTSDVSPRALKQLFRHAASSGLLGLTVGRAYGGLALDTMSSIIVHHELSKQSPGFCLAYFASDVLFGHNFAHLASSDIKAKILPKIATGRKIGAFALSEINAGTDVLSMQTVAADRGHSYLLNGSKIWITNGPIADYFLAYAKVVRQGEAADTTRSRAIGCFLVRAGQKGVHVGEIMRKCGMQPAVMCEITFRNVCIDKANCISTAKNGLKSLMKTFEIERLNLAAMGLGIAERCLTEMIRHARSRTTFGRPLSDYGQIQKYIAEGCANIAAARTLIYSIGKSRRLNRTMTDAAKLFAAPVAKKVADDAIQVCGALGYSGKMQLEQLWRDAKLLEIGGGTLEAHHKNIVRDLLKHT